MVGLNILGNETQTWCGVGILGSLIEILSRKKYGCWRIKISFITWLWCGVGILGFEELQMKGHVGLGIGINCTKKHFITWGLEFVRKRFMGGKEWGWGLGHC